MVLVKLHNGFELEQEQDIEDFEDEDKGVAEDFGTMMDNFITFKHELALIDKEIQTQLQYIDLWELANLLWDLQHHNIYAIMQTEMLKRSNGYLFNNVRMSPQFVAYVFELNYDEH